MAAAQHRFVGRITDSASARNAATQVALEIVDETLEIIINDDDQWAWDMADVSVSRVAIDRFHLRLADEDLYFLPVDPKAFSEDVMDRYSDTPSEPFRGFLRRRIALAQAEGDVDRPQVTAA